MPEQHWNRKFSTNIPDNYEHFFVPAIGGPVAEDLINRSSLRPGERVLDVACGTGTVARLAAQKVGNKGLVAGIDVNPGMLTVARSVTDAEISIDWYEANAEDMPLPDETFDVVLCQMGLQFMENKEVALKEMRRVLVPGGRLLLNVPGPIAEPFVIMAEAMKRNINVKAAGFVTKVFSLYESGEIEQIFNKAGFSDIDIQSKNKSLCLPESRQFLWQYIYSTPLAQVVLKTDEKARMALETSIVEKWQEFEDEGGFIKYQQPMVTAQARK